MRLSLAVLCCLSACSCATTVARLDGEVQTPAGPSLNACEEKSWLVIVPTRSQEADEAGITHARDDGLGLYDVGGSSPKSIPGLEAELDSHEIVQRKAEEVKKHDQHRIIGSVLGGVGLVAMVVGSFVFVSAFESKRTQNPTTGEVTEENTSNGTKLGAGIAVTLAGFGLGLGGLAVSPNALERTRADRARYVFSNPPDDPRVVTSLVAHHNQQVRERCGGGPAAPGGLDGPAPDRPPADEPPTDAPKPDDSKPKNPTEI